jgi:hypothetical protein
MVRWATLVLLTMFACAACNDLREFHGSWRGGRVGAGEILNVGMLGAGEATLMIDLVNEHQFAARLAIDGVLPATSITSVDSVEADALSKLTFSGAPLRVYLAFAAMPDGGGEALVVIALYDDRRIELRMLRGGTSKLYAIFALTEPTS